MGIKFEVAKYYATPFFLTGIFLKTEKLIQSGFIATSTCSMLQVEAMI